MKPTKMNQGSSRSHLIYDIKLTQMPYVAGEHVLDYSRIRIAKLSIIDLAGSERAVRTQNTGDRLNEASMINASLMTLRRCMEVVPPCPSLSLSLTRTRRCALTRASRSASGTALPRLCRSASQS